MPRTPDTGRLRRWAPPVASALALAALAFGLRADDLRTDLSAPAGFQPTPGQKPHFMVVPGGYGHPTDGEEQPWVGVYRPRAEGDPIDTVPRPEPSVGDVRGIVAAPDGSFVLLTDRADPCRSRLYRFRLTRDGHVTGFRPVEDGTVPALAAGLAVGPDARRIAFATSPCVRPSRGRPETALPPRAALTVLDTATGDRRSWTTSGPSVVG